MSITAFKDERYCASVGYLENEQLERVTVGAGLYAAHSVAVRAHETQRKLDPGTAITLETRRKRLVAGDRHLARHNCKAEGGYSSGDGIHRKPGMTRAIAPEPGTARYQLESECKALGWAVAQMACAGLFNDGRGIEVRAILERLPRAMVERFEMASGRSLGACSESLKAFGYGIAQSSALETLEPVNAVLGMFNDVGPEWVRRERGGVVQERLDATHELSEEEEDSLFAALDLVEVRRAKCLSERKRPLDLRSPGIAPVDIGDQEDVEVNPDTLSLEERKRLTPPVDIGDQEDVEVNPETLSLEDLARCGLHPGSGSDGEPS